MKTSDNAINRTQRKPPKQPQNPMKTTCTIINPLETLKEDFPRGRGFRCRCRGQQVVADPREVSEEG